MLNGKNILIVSSNQLVCIGLKTLLQEKFSPDEITIRADLDAKDAFSGRDIIFLSAEMYVRHQERFQTLKARVVILTDDPDRNGGNRQQGPDILVMKNSEHEILERLDTIFSSLAVGRSIVRQSDMLTPRETDVLTYVARGYLNKQIADALSISQHTVISHRKNITQKLGIKTVSGLTMYALLNGLISSKESG